MEVPPAQPLGDWLVALKEARAAVPQRGREFYAMRYLSSDAGVRAALAGYRAPDVLFNFSGVVQRSHGDWRTVPVAAIEMGDGNANPYALSVESEIRDGELGRRLLVVPRAVAGRRARAARVEALPARPRRRAAPLLRREPAPLDAVRLPLLALTQAQADALPRAIRAADPLTDMQQTMWRHKDTYQVFMCYRMPRRFDAAAFTAAAADWIGRHDCLRTFVHAERRRRAVPGRPRRARAAADLAPRRAGRREGARRRAHRARPRRAGARRRGAAVPPARDRFGWTTSSSSSRSTT